MNKSMSLDTLIEHSQLFRQLASYSYVYGSSLPLQREPCLTSQFYFGTGRIYVVYMNENRIFFSLALLDLVLPSAALCI